MSRTHTGLVACSLLCVGLLAGCGGGGKTTTTTTAATTTAAAGATTTAATSTSAAASTGSLSGLGALAGLSKCPQLAGLYTAAAAALTGSSNNVAKEVQTLQQYAGKTPSAIRADFETLAAAFAKVASGTKGMHLSSGGALNPAALAKLEALGAQLNSPALSKAEQAIGTWATQNCHA